MEVKCPDHPEIYFIQNYDLYWKCPMSLGKRLLPMVVVVYWLPLGIFQILYAIRTDYSLVYFILGVHSLFFGYFLLRRREESSGFPWYIQMPILLSMFLSSFFHYTLPTTLAGVLLSVLGFLLSIWALISLGEAVGITPANRGLVVRGPYQYLRHPMYAGYLISALPVLIYSFSFWNCALYCIIAASFVIRILLEERVLSDYETYKHKVRWRIIPYLW
jgi:protein-S-isoprenylcysteine O-methyltransferase Ste14